MRELVLDLARWFSTGFDHVFGNPLEERLHQPPQVGVQPFSGTIRKRGRKAGR